MSLTVPAGGATPRRTGRRLLLAFCAAVVAVSTYLLISWRLSATAPVPVASDDGIRVEVVATGLEVPWAIAFTPDGRIIFTERPGRVRVIERGQLRPAPLATLEDVVHRSEGGLMGLALHPDFRRNRWLYLSYVYDAGEPMVRVVRYRETGAGLTNRKVILEGIPAAMNHAGCALRFGPDRKLYISTGDATDRRIAQQLDNLGGKMLRVNDDGSRPSDNPFANSLVWTLGHRNGQGFDWHPVTRALYESEHGPSVFDGPPGGDEVNHIVKGKNYGWPLVSHDESRPGMEDPVRTFTPAIAPASGSFYRGGRIPRFRNSFFVGGLRGAHLLRVKFDERQPRRVLEIERLFQDRYGRIRAVEQGPDGALYFSTSNRDGRGRPTADDDRILRIVPASSTSR